MKLWGGRFEKKTSAQVDDFHSSIHFDYRMYRHDIRGSIAHARMLGRQNIIPAEQAELICSTLQQLLEEIDSGQIQFSVEAEDIHMNIETLLIERIGDAGKKLHTGRSRNDQVALDTRMYMMEETECLLQLLGELEDELLKIAGQNIETCMPGYTHLQKAQPVTLAHHLMAYFEMFRRDMERLKDCQKRINIMPLGSGALAGTTYDLDRHWVAKELGFADITRNSLDAVSDRDFIIEALSCCSMIMMHLSRFCEELILWSTDEFRFIEMDDSYSTGSSIMPQKKNPDVAELVRGKTGRVYGNLMALLTVMKGLPLAYNKDMQEDKEAMFDSLDTVKKCIQVFTGMISTVKFNQAQMERGALSGFANATDAADYLVKKGLPFRSAHEVIGRLVLHCIKEGKGLLDLTLSELRELSPLFEDDVYDALSLNACVNERKLPGGPAAKAVAQAIDEGRVWLEAMF
ncbi:MAG: argininosuccinate lyase [Caldicoprobacterales bacterium]|jgi:argininosuccinate lyase|nr:argininosuccinate lyase [Clostridiales bacterium]